MRKRIITPVQKQKPSSNEYWLDLEKISEVEISSEDKAYPIEFALLPNQGNNGWRATEPGEQTIRLLFSVPQTLEKIYLSFEETQIERTQEYLLRWFPDNGQTFQEILRQQWNFNPQGSMCEIEEHYLGLSSVTIFELIIIPDINGGDNLACLKQLRLS
ncbi:MAG: carbohydrate-binding protein [Methylococcaceae bacterium]|nr:carbohydrate-binding protein [Methylococcaceae bacterium]